MERLKELRKIKNVSQAEFAKYMNVAQNTVSRWENGDRLMDTETLLRAAEYFNVTADYLLGRKPEQIAAGNRTPLQSKLLSEFYNLNDIGKREAIKRVSELAEIPKYTRDTDAAMPIAAHTDAEITDKELELMQQDIDEL